MFKLFEKNKQIANNFLVKKEFANSLEYYNKCISLLKHAPKIEVIKTLLNRTSCYLYMEQYENVINECSKLILSIHKQKNIYILKNDEETLLKLKQLEFAVYVRRAAAYNNISKYFEAYEDFTKANELKPEDQEIKENIKKLKMKL